MLIFYIGIFSIFLAYFLIGNFAGKRVKNLDDYYVDGRNASTFLILGTLVASYMEVGMFMGDSGLSYDGYPVVILVMISFLTAGYSIGAVFFGRYLRRSNSLTLADFFYKRFRSQHVQKLFAITMCVGLVTYLVCVTQGASVIFSTVLNIPRIWALLLVFFIYIFLTFYGGSRGVIISDTMMFLVFGSAIIIVCPFILKAGGGWDNIFENLQSNVPGMLSWHGSLGAYPQFPAPGDPIVYGVITGLICMFITIGGPWQSSRFLMAKNEHVVLRSSALAGVSVAIMYLFVLIGSTAGRVIEPLPANGEQVFLNIAKNIVPAVPGMLLIAGILSAAISSATTFVSLIGFTFTNDIIGQKRFKNEKQQMHVTKAVILIAGIIAVIMCYSESPFIFWLAIFANSIFASSFGPISICSIWYKKLTPKGAFWGMLFGFAGNVGVKLFTVLTGLTLPIYVDPFVIGLILNIAAMIVFSHITQNSAEGLEYVNKLVADIPDCYSDPKENRMTKLVIIICAILLIMIVSVMIAFYGIRFL